MTDVGYGLGLMQDHNIWWHNGQTIGYRSLLLVSPSDRWVIAISANKEQQGDFASLVEKVLDIFYGSSRQQKVHAILQAIQPPNHQFQEIQ